MMIRFVQKTTLCVVAAFFFVVSTAQELRKVEALERANMFNELAGDEELVRPESIVEFTFNRPSSSEGTVSASKKMSDVFVCMKDGYRYKDGIGFDEKSSVSHLKSRDEKKKRLYIYGSYAKYEQKGIFHSDASIYYWSLPFSRRGEYITTEITKTFDDVKYLTSVYFKKDTPVKNRLIKFVIPMWLEVELLEMNFDGYAIKKSESTEDGNKIVTYQIEDLSSFKRENMSPMRAKREPHLLVVAKSYKLENGSTEKLFGSVDDLYGWYHSLVKKVENEPEEVKPIVEGLIKDKSTDIERIESIFYWVQDNIRYVAFEEGIMGFKPEECQKVYGNKYGDCKGMANLTKEMLKIAGFDARLTWIGTRDIPYDYSIPSLAVDNHMICTVFLEDKKYYLDATEKFIALGDYAQRIQGRPVLIEDGESYILETVPEFDAERNKEFRKERFTLEGNVLKGKVETEFNGESKIMLLYVLDNMTATDRNEALSGFLNDDNGNYMISDIKTSDLSNRSKTFSIDYLVQFKNQVTEAGSEKFVSLLSSTEYSNFDLDEDRVSDLEFRSKILKEQEVILEVPSGATVDYLPEKFEISTEDYSFLISYELKGNEVHLKKKLEVPDGLIPIEEKDEWNSAIKKLRAAYKEQIVLKY